MKILALALMFALSAPAFALTYQCSKNDGTDSAFALSFDKNGTFALYPYEGSIEIEKNLLTVETAKSPNTGKVDTHIVMVQNATVKTFAEGEEGTATVTAVFVYNPAQKAGRLTAVVGGYSVARNELFTDCKEIGR